MSRFTPREIVKMLAAEVDDSDPHLPDDSDGISDWEPVHSCGGDGDPGCAACWLHDYDRAVARANPEPHDPEETR